MPGDTDGHDSGTSVGAAAVAERRLPASYDFASVVEKSSEGVLILDRDGLVRYANAAAARLLGRTRERLLGRPLDFPAIGGQGLHVERPRPGAQPAVLWVRAEAPDPEGLGGQLVTLQDVTDRRRLEDQLRRSSRLDALGLLAGGVAHDFKNLVTVINGYCSRLLRREDLPEAARRELGEVGKAGERAGKLAGQLLAFSRKRCDSHELLDLNAMLSSLRDMLDRMLGEGTELCLELAAGLGPVRADPVQIERVIVNLAANARDAMSLGGRLTISTGRAAAPRPDLPGPGEWVTLTVADTGGGMSEAVRSRLFEPFFTTKKAGKGTGLGLAAVRGILRQAGGGISVESQPGRGSTFTIFLPAADAKAGAGARRDQAGGSETVLLVEDEEELRELIRLELAGRGYRVLSARDGHEALVACERHHAAIPLMITDVAMPRIRGPQLFDRLKPLCPEMKVVYISGCADPEELGGRLSPGSAVFLAKPFAPDRLLRVVRKLLGPAGEGRASAN